MRARCRETEIWSTGSAFLSSFLASSGFASFFFSSVSVAISSGAPWLLGVADRQRHVAHVDVPCAFLVPVVAPEAPALDELPEGLAVGAQRLERLAMPRRQVAGDAHVADRRALLGLLVEAERRSAARERGQM